MSEAGVWLDSFDLQDLAENCVHIWRVWVDLPASTTRKFVNILSQDEIARASRFRFDPDRTKYILRRAALRRLLAGYHGISPGELMFSTNAYGKPHTINSLEYPTIYFNCSQSGSWALFAFSLGFEVGIDVEVHRQDVETLRLAERFFSPSEIRDLDSLSEEEQLCGFFLCWTRKEAFIKGHGEGLSIPLDQFDVNLVPGVEAKLLSTRGNLEPADEWTLYNIEVAPGYSGALAAHVRNPRVAFFDYAIDSNPGSTI